MTKENDIALAKLNRNVRFQLPQGIRPTCLWQEEEIGQNKTIAIGWGYTSYARETSVDLMKVQLDILNNNVCTRTFEDHDVVINGRNQICAGVLAGGKVS